MLKPGMLHALNEVAMDFFAAELRRSPHGEAQAYLYKRGVSDSTRDTFHIGFCPFGHEVIERIFQCGFTSEMTMAAGITRADKNTVTIVNNFAGRIIFPIQDVRGRVLGFGARTLKSEKKFKYLNSPDSPAYHKSETLYALHMALPHIRKKQRVIVTEGYLDVCLLHQVGILESVAACGISITEQQLYLLKATGAKVYFLLDGDKPGKAAAERASGMCKSMQIEHEVRILPDEKDPAELAQENPAALHEIVKE